MTCCLTAVCFGREPLSGKTPRSAHSGEVRGISADARNHHLLSAGADGWLRIWDFKLQRMHSEVQVGVPVTKLATHPGTALVATAADDHVLRM